MTLPIEQNIPQIINALRANKNVILTAEPGAGKSTMVPISLLYEEWLKGKKIIMLQPRRVAAISIANRMAQLTNTTPGKTIGYRIRFNSNVTETTKIEVVTEGILTKKIQKDPFLEDIGLIIFDEFHERSINADLGLALCKEIQSEVNPDLRIMVMSATINTEQLSNFLPNSEIITGKGFLYPVEITYKPIAIGSRYIFEDIAKQICNIINSSINSEEYLVFLPGSGEINLIYNYLLENLKTNHEIMRLYGLLNIQEQEKALHPGSKPRIILSTNIAETSLTIEGITTVIDSGYCKKLNFDITTSLEKLETERISKASARQRAGRAGRLRSGKCIRLWNKTENEFLKENDIPEIMRSDISTTILEIIAWGCKDPRKFNWFQNPGNERIDSSINLLKMLRAIDEKGNITELGNRISEIPTEARLAKMLIYASQKGSLNQAALAAAIMSEKDFISNDENGYEPDIEYRLEIINKRKYGNNATVKRILKISEQLKSIILSKQQTKINQDNPIELRKALLTAFPDRVCLKQNTSDSYTSYSGNGLTIDSNSIISNENYILALKADSALRQSTSAGRIFLACKIDKQWLFDNLGAPYSINNEVYFSNNKNKVIARKQIKYGKLIISEQEIPINQELSYKASEIFIKSVLEKKEIAFNLKDKDNENFINRVNLIVKNKISDLFPEINTNWFITQLKTNLYGIYSFDELKKYKISELYFMQLPYNAREKFEKLVPERYEVPSKSHIKINYQSDNNPILAVKIQELFGLNQTPSICDGKIKLIIHLLSPAGRPVQVTQDLVSFWENGYKQVVGELKGRYPKHPWPDKPQDAIPTSKTNNALRKQGLI